MRIHAHREDHHFFKLGPKMNIDNHVNRPTKSQIQKKLERQLVIKLVIKKKIKERK